MIQTVSHTPHLPGGIQFELCRFRSPLLTTSRLISFPPPTKMFQFGGFPIQRIDQLRSGSPIRESPDPRLHASPRSLSQLGTPFFGTQTEPSTNRFNVSSKIRYQILTVKIHLTSSVYTFTQLHHLHRGFLHEDSALPR